MDAKIYSVSELTQLIREILEDSFPAIWIEGEISNYRPQHSGHLYFTLKDAGAQISCVMWRSRAAGLESDPEDGQKVKIFGNIRVYEKGGRYQLDILTMQPAGLGELQQRFEQLKAQLHSEGLFDPAVKKDLPKFPKSIGIITSPTGAAIRDIVSVVSRRAPSVNMILRGVKVQGIGAAEEIAHAIDLFNDYNKVDVLIIGRGGGSLEDLWPFNEETVARAVYQSHIPVISAVGHEIDYAISDFVADVRAATPSAAAEMVAPADKEIRDYVLQLQSGLRNTLLETISLQRTKLQGIMRSHAFRRPETQVLQHSQRLDDMIHRLNIATAHKLKHWRNIMQRYTDQLTTLNPENVLNRGYAMALKEGTLITSAENVEVDDTILIKLADGALHSNVLRKEYDKKT